MINNQSPFAHVRYVSGIKRYIRFIKIILVTPIVKLSCTWLQGAMRFITNTQTYRKRRRVKIYDKSRCKRQSVQLSRLDDVACKHVLLSTSAQNNP